MVQLHDAAVVDDDLAAVDLAAEDDARERGLAPDNQFDVLRVGDLDHADERDLIVAAVQEDVVGVVRTVDRPRDARDLGVVRLLRARDHDHLLAELVALETVDALVGQAEDGVLDDEGVLDIEDLGGLDLLAVVLDEEGNRGRLLIMQASDGVDALEVQQHLDVDGSAADVALALLEQLRVDRQGEVDAGVGLVVGLQHRLHAANLAALVAVAVAEHRRLDLAVAVIGGDLDAQDHDVARGRAGKARESQKIQGETVHASLQFCECV